MRKVCIWPDNDWCELEDVGQYSWKSDDYEIKEVDDEWEG